MTLIMIWMLLIEIKSHLILMNMMKLKKYQIFWRLRTTPSMMCSNEIFQCVEDRPKFGHRLKKHQHQSNQEQKNKLLDVLKEYKYAIEWTILKSKVNKPLVYMHKIIIKYGTNLVRDTQRSLNPNMIEMMKKEVLKC